MRSAIAIGAVLLLAASGCGSDKKKNETPADGGMDAGPTADAGGQGDGGLSSDELVARGDYLVNAVAKCGDCHSPKDAMGADVKGKEFSGVDCFIGIEFPPMSGKKACLNSANLTNDETGLSTRSDAEVKDLFLNGKRPDGKALFNIMPYWTFHNMSDQDANAIVAYLRTLKGVKHMVKPSDFPFTQDKPANPVDLSKVPSPKKGDANFDRAMKGRYLAANLGICLECHTPENQMTVAGQMVTNPMEPRVLSKAFTGGRVFPRDALGLPPIFPELIYTANLTPDATGLKDWTIDDIVTALKTHKDEMGEELCAPMPLFDTMTEEDATDIAYYLKSLPPVKTNWPECSPMAPPSGDAGAADSGT